MSSIEQQVKAIVAEQLGVKEEEVTNDASFVDDLGAGKEAAGEPLSELEAQIEVMGADVRQQVARRGGRGPGSWATGTEPPRQLFDQWSLPRADAPARLLDAEDRRQRAAMLGRAGQEDEAGGIRLQPIGRHHCDQLARR